MKSKFFVHRTTKIEKGVKIGKGTKIWQNCQILKGARIGENCMIGHNCFIAGRAKIGNGVKLESNTDVWDLITLEDYVFIGPSAVFTNDKNPRAKYPKREYPRYGKWLPILVKEGATIGANATIVAGHSIGKWAMIGAGTVVADDIPDFALVYGVPARFISWICECGSKIEFNGKKAICKICKRNYQKKRNKIWQIK